jgi:acetolactate synthase I/II/III large subunit
MKLTGSQILIKCLLEQGVDTVFGYPGGSVLFIYDELFKNQDKIKHILTAHEQGAAHAADGYARATGKIGVCMATSGPGATNLVTGIATAYMDSIPIVAITGNVPVGLLGRDSFQEVDITGITMSITKHNYIVRDVTKLADVIRDAFRIAGEGRPGPVLIDIPKDVSNTLCDFEDLPVQKKSVAPTAGKAQMEEALKLINESKRPMIYCGGGTLKCGAQDEIVEFAHKIGSPVACSLMGLPAFPGRDDLFTGMVGMHGTKASNMGVTHSDLLIVLGARFSDRVVGKMDKFAPGAQILQIDIDPAEVNKNIETHHHIIGDVKAILKEFNQKVDNSSRPEWLKKIDGWKEDDSNKQAKNHMARHIITTLDDLVEDNAVISTEVGQHQMWVAQYFKFKKGQSFLTSGGLGTMGYGFGASIGAKIACPDRQVINVAGDGSFRMNLNEMATVVRFNLPLKIVLLDNHSLGMVRQWQNMFYDERYSHTTLMDTDFCKIAESFGIKAVKIESEAEAEAKLKEAIDYDGPVLVHCIIDNDEKVLPIVPPGDSIDRLVMSDHSE